MKQRITLYADEGKLLTDGTNYGKIIHLAEGADASPWHEITEAEYNAIMAQENGDI